MLYLNSKLHYNLSQNKPWKINIYKKIAIFYKNINYKIINYKL